MKTGDYIDFNQLGGVVFRNKPKAKREGKAHLCFCGRPKTECWDTGESDNGKKPEEKKHE